MSDTKNPETPIQACLSGMRAKIARIEACGIKPISDMAMDLRHQMISLTSLVNGLEVDIGVARMVGRAEPLKPQAPIDDLPIFTHAHGHVLSADEIDAMEAFRHREGDHTQDMREGGR